MADKRKLTGIELILFDLDGTLIDTIDLIHDSFKYATLTVLNKNYDRKTLLKNIGRPLLDQMREFSKDKAEELMDVYHRHNLANHDQMVRAYPGTERALKKLVEQGFRLGVVTSKRKDLAERGLMLCHLDGLVELLVAMEDTEQHKPAPQPVLLALAGFNVKNVNTVFVGDSPFDIEAGKSAGTITVAALWGPFSREDLIGSGPDFYIEKIENIFEILG